MMATKDEMLPWGLHELEGSRRVGNDAGNHESQKNLDDLSQEKAEVDDDSDSAPKLTSTANEPAQDTDPDPTSNSTCLPNATNELLIHHLYLPPHFCHTANDALIAQALQEEFHRLEAAGDLCVKQQESILGQTWIEQSESSVGDSSSGEASLDHIDNRTVEGVTFTTGGNNNLGHVTVYDWERRSNDMDLQKMGNSAASSSFRDNSPYAIHDEDRQVALALSDNPQVDKDIARRLTKFEPMKHVPRINRSIPTYEDASADHQRLLDRLEMYGLAEQKIKGDGNCQFRALSDQLYRSPDHHKYVRKCIVKQLRTTPDAYENYVPMKYSNYLKTMAKNGEWGDHVTLQAAADYYGVKISLITSFKDTCFIEIAPTEQKSEREMYLSFWSEVHYNSIYPVGELPRSLEDDYSFGVSDVNSRRRNLGIQRMPRKDNAVKRKKCGRRKKPLKRKTANYKLKNRPSKKAYSRVQSWKRSYVFKRQSPRKRQRGDGNLFPKKLKYAGCYFSR